MLHAIIHMREEFCPLQARGQGGPVKSSGIASQQAFVKPVMGESEYSTLVIGYTMVPCFDQSAVHVLFLLAVNSQTVKRRNDAAFNRPGSSCSYL